MKISDLLRNLLEEIGEDNISDIYFHREYTCGTLQLNIEFKDNNIVEEFLYKQDENGIRESNSVAVWE